jgi:hypothetical protein
MSNIAFAFRPLSSWPAGLPVRPFRKASQFKANWSSTTGILAREVAALGASEAIIQLDVGEDDIRIDGQLKANAQFRSPRVVVSLKSKHGHLAYPCDRYQHWRDNVRAIALAMEALRAVDRYGVTSRGEQYRGWQALPPPSATQSVGTDPKIYAAQTLAKHSGRTMQDVMKDVEDAYRIACARTHPDRGGNPDDFKAVQEAKAAL